ncbi:MAG TPA: gamma-glutamyl-gamma-aminobutyrate hydrolase family protein [Anaeromyxobacteraceae bacterium]|nr:gamma-glutamyl-gamma-aminobutyrate hydrolase family protein [Anaeromyxobacteraceae bacterium]
MRRVLILQAGSAPSPVRARFGDYPHWFARLMGFRVELSVVRPYERALPFSGRFHGILMTGSPRSVLEPEPWMERTAAYLIDAARTRPVLGVCFGHQLLAIALGARVEKNPRGPEAGTAVIHLTRAGTRDPLFAGLPLEFPVQQTHEDHVSELPPGATLLAKNGFSPVQAFAVGDAIRCVQFHPEMDAPRSRCLAGVRTHRLDAQAPGGSRAVLSSIRETKPAERILANWLERFLNLPRDKSRGF